MRILLTDLDDFVEQTVQKVRAGIVALTESGLAINQELTIDFAGIEPIYDPQSLTLVTETETDDETTGSTIAPEVTDTQTQAAATSTQTETGERTKTGTVGTITDETTERESSSISSDTGEDNEIEGRIYNEF